MAPGEMTANKKQQRSQQEPDMQGTIMSLDSAIQMISEKKRAVIGEPIGMIGHNETDDGVGGELTSLEEMDMSNMQD